MEEITQLHARLILQMSVISRVSGIVWLTFRFCYITPPNKMLRHGRNYFKTKVLINLREWLSERQLSLRILKAFCSVRYVIARSPESLTREKFRAKLLLTDKNER